MRNHKLLFLITLLYFSLGLVNIHFALLGLICMFLPIYLLVRDKRKTWCQSYCPRASLYSKIGKAVRKQAPRAPRFFLKGDMKWIVLAYFGISLFFITVSTVRVAKGLMPPMYHLRFLLAFPLGNSFPQLVKWVSELPWLTHLAYRFFSMMTTTTVLGLILAMLYKPRTWCTICPIATVSDVYLTQSKQSQSCPRPSGCSNSKKPQTQS